MAAPKRTDNVHVKKPQMGTLSKLGITVALAGTLGFAGYKVYEYLLHQSRQQSEQQNDDNEDSSVPLYKPTPLGDYDDTEDANNTTFYTSNEAEDGQPVSVRQEYIGNLLRARRFSSVLINPHLHHDKEEHYFHLGLNSSSPLLAKFGRIKWVIFVKTKSDVQLVARRILHEFQEFIEEKDGNELPQPIGSTDRYYMLQIASIIIVSCGIGAPSVSILLEEITKLLVDAGAFSPNENNSSLSYQTSYVEYILLGSAPGIQISPSKKVAQRRKSLSNIFDNVDSNTTGGSQRSRSGSVTPTGDKRFDLNALKVDLKAERQRSTELYGAGRTVGAKTMDDEEEKRPSQVTKGEIPVIIPTSCFDEKLSNYREMSSCGKIVDDRQMKFDRNLIYDIKLRCSFLRSLKPRQGKGLSVQYLHEALSHNSVAINQDSNVKSKFIQSCIDRDVKYVDMESGYFAAFCNTLSISSVAIIGIEYDIAAPSKDSMRVTHNSALQATLDVVCQYLWDRIKKTQEVSSLKRAVSQRVNAKKISGDGDDEERDGGDMDIQRLRIGKLEKANSWNGSSNAQRGRRSRNDYADEDEEDAAPPAPAFAADDQIQHVYLSPNAQLENEDENDNEGDRD